MTHTTLPHVAQEIIKEKRIEFLYLYLIWLRGFSYKNKIGVSSRLNIYRQRWTIAHELWHIVNWHEHTIVWVPFWKSQNEKDADQFAFDLLLPKRELLEECEIHDWDLWKLEIVFWVEKSMIEKRIKELFK